MSVILTCNAGSTNTKLAIFDEKTLERKGHAVTHNAAETLEWMCSAGELGISAIGHRVVHGGREFTQPVQLDERRLEMLRSYIPLAPLHQPAALKWIEEACKLYPKVKQIACFDTAFHQTTPEIERRLALPVWYYQHGVQRYGFHGLSYQYLAGVLPAHGDALADGCVIAAHLGGGASACAMKGLKSVATTMGFSTLDGLMMGTRCGTLDAGVVLYLLKELEMTIDEVDRLLYLESGLRGVSGVSADMRELVASDKPAAREAVDLYCYLAAKQIAGLLPALGRLDALVFTGGIGENNPDIRNRIANALRFAGDFPVYAVPTDEEKVIAGACYNTLKIMNKK